MKRHWSFCKFLSALVILSELTTHLSELSLQVTVTLLEKIRGKARISGVFHLKACQVKQTVFPDLAERQICYQKSVSQKQQRCRQKEQGKNLAVQFAVFLWLQLSRKISAVKQLCNCKDLNRTFWCKHNVLMLTLQIRCPNSFPWGRGVASVSVVGWRQVMQLRG